MSEAVLKELRIPYEHRADGTLFVPGDIDLSGWELSTLPDLSNVRVGGSFFCMRNKLTTLAGAPLSVEGSFHCDNNQITTLRGTPKSVGGDFFCGQNMLKNLEGAPLSVGKEFWCHNNLLTTLEGAPQQFKKLASNFGIFYSWDEVPEELRTSPETRQRILDEKIMRASTTQKPVKLLPKIKVRR